MRRLNETNTGLHMQVNTPISLGELADKLTILEIKLDKISNTEKLQNINKEHDLLKQTLNQVIVESALNKDEVNAFKDDLKAINEQLWVIEDDIRECERNNDFSNIFIELARSVYITNDKRAAVKNAMNHKFGSDLVEEKSYESY